MIINEAGEYTLQYTATDACGNSTTVERELTVEAPPTYRTVLYTDGTFIINESSLDEAANIALHGVATNVYNPFDPNGATNIDKYIFASSSLRPWYAQRSLIKDVEVGSDIYPTTTKYWFSAMDCNSFDFSKLHSDNFTDASYMFSDYTGQHLPIGTLDTRNVTNMAYMFKGCSKVLDIDFSNFNTQNVSSMADMFESWVSSSGLKVLDLSNFDTRNLVDTSYMFSGSYYFTSIDLSSFDTSDVTNMTSMFYNCQKLTTVYVGNGFVTDAVTRSTDMFGVGSGVTLRIAGGAGTTWNSSNPTDKTYAHIDGGVSDPGYFTAKS